MLVLSMTSGWPGDDQMGLFSFMHSQREGRKVPRTCEAMPKQPGPYPVLLTFFLRTVVPAAGQDAQRERWLPAEAGMGPRGPSHPNCESDPFQHPRAPERTPKNLGSDPPLLCTISKAPI